MEAGCGSIPSWQPIIINGRSAKISHVDDVGRIVVIFFVSPPVLIQIPLYPLEHYNERKRQFDSPIDVKQLCRAPGQVSG